jgi:uncharacterized membrane protein (UPF0127 family)
VKQVIVRNVSRANATLGSHIQVADTFWTRLKGLLGAPPLRRGEGLLLQNCQAVHMFGMKQSLDVAFVSGEQTVIALYHDLLPGQRSGFHSKARGALELPPGTLMETDTRVGDLLTVHANGNESPSGDGEDHD